jgi:hypothetical protein
MKLLLNPTPRNKPNKADGRKRSLNLHIGEAVEVRSKREVLNTLDENGTFEGLQFSSEMWKYCGQKFTVFKRADKLIIEGIGMRRMKRTVILAGATCDGLAHESCKKTCLLLWKDVWLKRISGGRPEDVGENPPTTDSQSLTKETFQCQVSGLKNATSALPFWDARQYVWDIKSGAFSPSERLRILLTSISIDFRKLLGSKVIRHDHGHLRRTPSLALDLQPGEIVQVNSKAEIIRTLDSRNRNRGLEFTQEMSKYSGKKYQVLKRVDIIKDEKTGEMRKIANTVLLEEVTCDGKAHGGCPRNCFCLWREIWLSRVPD